MRSSEHKMIHTPNYPKDAKQGDSLYLIYLYTAHTLIR